MSGQFMMDIASASTDRIELKLKFPKMVPLQVSILLNDPVWWNIWNMVDYSDDLNGFNNGG